MNCPKCGKELPDNAKFCGFCAESIYGDIPINNVATNIEQNVDNSKINAYLSSVLFNKDEHILAVLGNSTIQKFISTGVLGNGFAILTDKRIYFKGKCLIRHGKGFYKKTEEKAVDLKDVTGTGFVYNKAFWAVCAMVASIFLSFFAGLAETFTSSIVFGILMIVLMISCPVFLFIFLKYNYSAFEISYAGGGIGFDIHWITSAESSQFQTKLRLIKDEISKTETQTSVVQNFNVPEQLLQYKSLLDQGVITQEEFDSMKEKLLR